MKFAKSLVPALLLAYAPAVAQDAGGLPDLTGVWVSDDSVCYHVDSVTVNTSVVLTITEQEARFVRGERSWAHDGDAVMDAPEGELTTEASEKVVGAFDARGETVHFVEHDDIGHFIVTVIDDDTLDSVYAESGRYEAICTQTFRRQG